MKITLEAYHHTCDDGCCDNYGYNVFVGRKLVGTIEGDSLYQLTDLLNLYVQKKKNTAGDY